MPKPPVFWSRCEDTASLNNPIVGSGAVIGSPSYAASKFGNGVNCSSGGLGQSITVSNTAMAEGCIEFWFKANAASTSYINNYWLCGSSSYPIFVFSYNDWGNSGKFGVLHYFNGTYYVWELPAFSSGEVIHYATVWSTAKLITGSQTVAVFWNGVKQTAMVSPSNDPTATLSLPAFTVLRVGRGTGSEYANMIIDNIKLYDYAKQDFSDRFNERGGMNDIILS